MTPLLINTYDTRGGAAIAAFRLLKGLNRNGIPAKMLAQEKQGEYPNVVTLPRGRFRSAAVGLRSVIDQQPLRSLYPKRRPVAYSLNWLPGGHRRMIRKLEPEVINLHWVNAGFLSLEMIGRIKQPVVWTLHDMWPFTGVCHYSSGCLKFKVSCGTCPLLGSNTASDLSRWNWYRKRSAIKKLDLTVVTPSRWLAKKAGESRLLCDADIHVIPNGVDPDVFRPVPKQLVRDLFGVDGKKKVILFGGAHALTDRRKGAHFLDGALQLIKERDPLTPLEILIFGASIPQNGLSFHYETKYLGFIQDERLMAQAFAAADIYVTSPTQENLANTVIESLACGTPVVAFDVGGMGDMISHKENGYLARAMELTDLAEGIQWALENGERLNRLSVMARETVVQKFDAGKNARCYMRLFDQLVLDGPSKKR